MNRSRNTFSLILVTVSMLFGMAAVSNAQVRNDRDIRDTIRSLNSKVDDFDANIRYQMQSSSANNSQISGISDDVRALKDSVRQFQDNFDGKRDSRDDVNKIVNAARNVDEFLRNNPQNKRVGDDWAEVRKQIDRLSSNYGITTSWNGDRNSQNVPYDQSVPQTGTINVGLSGTYTLDPARSEKVDDIVADTSLGPEQREDLKEKLVAPEQIAIDIRGDQVTLASTHATPVTITADGRDKTEQSPTGKTIRMRATLGGQTLIVSSLGGETDYSITFTSVSDGQVMKVSRRITTDYLSQTVFVESIYNKTDPVAKLGIQPGANATPSAAPTDPNVGYSDNDQSGGVSNGGSSNGGQSNGGQRNGGSSGGRPPNGGQQNGGSSQGRGPVAVTTRPGNYVVPNGTVITGTLENEINTKVSQNNDRFRMTVQSPDEFRGATVEGYISGVDRSGRISGQSNLTFNFEKITLKDGKTYDFAANVQDVRDQSGKLYTVDNEGTIKGDNQTKETAKRGGIGGGIGAVIGAIAGGGKGAVIGAIIGAGGGAGSVAIQGNSDVQLKQGSTITVQSSSPINSGPR